MKEIFEVVLIVVLVFAVMGGLICGIGYLTYNSSKESCVRNMQFYTSISSDKEIKWYENGWAESQCIIKLELKNDEPIWINLNDYLAAVEP
jgi:hypothetical protein